LMSLSFAERAQKVVFLPQSLPQGVHLHVLESIIVVLRASGGRCEIYPTSHFLTIARGTFSKALDLSDLWPLFMPLLIAVPVVMGL
ncbi:hypothetical protein MJM28_27755, partial [Salmonella enterica subsp. enterica serovar Montevideo]|nr:hypothetical protein [Salmonella enterica subsp. enterica serovar Montevideo]